MAWINPNIIPGVNAVISPPVGINLLNPLLWTIPPMYSGIAYDLTSARLCVGAGGVWLPLGYAGELALEPFGTVPNAEGGSAFGSGLTLQPAATGFPGAVSTTGQAFSGPKNFLDGITITSNPTFRAVTSFQVGGLIPLFNNPLFFDAVSSQPDGGDINFLSLVYNGAKTSQFPVQWIIYRIGSLVTLTMRGFSDSVFNAGAFGFNIQTNTDGTNAASPVIPLGFRPGLPQVVPCLLVNGGAFVNGAAGVFPNGVLNLYNTIAGSSGTSQTPASGFTANPMGLPPAYNTNIFYTIS